MAAVPKIEEGVVELRTDVGRLYVCPTRWQRLYLRWTFRNFHSLPQQILNQRQKRLIENLCRSAIVTTAERVPAGAIIGIVENMRVLGLPSSAEIAEAAHTAKPAVGDVKLAVVQGSAEEAAVRECGAGVERTPVRRDVAREMERERAIDSAAGEREAIAAAAQKHDSRRGSSLQLRSAVLGGAAVLAAAFWLIPQWRLPEMSVWQAPAPGVPSQFAAELQPATPSVASAAAKQDARLPVSEPKPLKAEDAAVAARQPEAKRAPSAGAGKPGATTLVQNAERLPQIVEAPRSGFIYPVAPNPNLVGIVVLKAVVGSDGSVKQVAVLSGDRALAVAAVRAVRQWRYAPPEVGGRTVDAETQVTISFLGDDAVSIILPQR